MYRTDFPIFSVRPELIYLDSAATTQKPAAVIEAVHDFLVRDYAPVRRGMYPLSVNATKRYEQARNDAARFIGAASPREIVVTFGATDALNLVAEGLCSQLTEGDQIVLSEAEHHANLVPWQQAAHRYGLLLKFAQVTPEGRVDLAHLEQLISKSTKIVSLTHCSNVLGTITPLAEVKKIIDRQGSGIRFVTDASQSASHLPVNVQDLGCDFLVFSGHKLYGPSGVGVLWGREELLDSIPPLRTGGEMVESVSLTSATWSDVPERLEAGTPNIEGVIGLGEAIRYLSRLGMDTVARHTGELSRYLLERLRGIPGLQIIGAPDPESGIVSFVLPTIHPHDLADMLGSRQVCIRAGQHCAAPLHHKFDIVASNRVSIGIYTTEEEIDRFISILSEITARYA